MERTKSKFSFMSLDFWLFSSLLGMYYRYPSFSRDGTGFGSWCWLVRGRQVQGYHVQVTSGHANPNTITVWVQWRVETTNSRSSWSLLGQWNKDLVQFPFQDYTPERVCGFLVLPGCLKDIVCRVAVDAISSAKTFNRVGKTGLFS